MNSLPKWISPNMKQTWVVIPTILYKISSGMSFGFSTCLAAAVQDPESGIKMDKESLSWYVSSIGMAFMIGYTAAIILSRFGRRLSFLLCCLPAIIGLFFNIFSSNVTVLVVSRILAGISIGSHAVIGSIVIGEYTSPQNRGMYLNMSTASLNIGSFLAHILGEFIHWRTLVVIIHAPFLISILITYTWPESPSWLAEKKQYEKSREAFYWLRGRTEETTREIEELIRAQNNKKIVMTILDHIKVFFLKFKMKNFWKPMFVTFLTNVLMETSGRHLIPAYAIQLINEILPTGLKPFYYNMAIDSLMVFGSIMSVYLIRIMKLRRLLFLTGFISCILLFIAGLTLYLIKNDIISYKYSWFSLFMFASFCVSTNFACTCVPLAMFGEIFPLEHRVVASTILWYLSGSMITIILKIIPFMLAKFYIYGTFIILAGITAVVLHILYFILPETKNKTLQEIENYFKYGNYRDGVKLPTSDNDEVL